MIGLDFNLEDRTESRGGGHVSSSPWCCSSIQRTTPLAVQQSLWYRDSFSRFRELAEVCVSGDDAINTVLRRALPSLPTAEHRECRSRWEFPRPSIDPGRVTTSLIWWRGAPHLQQPPGRSSVEEAERVLSTLITA